MKSPGLIFEDIDEDRLNIYLTKDHGRDEHKGKSLIRIEMDKSELLFTLEEANVIADNIKVLCGDFITKWETRRNEKNKKDV